MLNDMSDDEKEVLLRLYIYGEIRQLGYPWGYECLKYGDSVFQENFQITEEYKMYIIYRIDNDDGDIVKTPIGVVNGDESVAVRWMSENNIAPEKFVAGMPFPHFKQQYIRELKI